MSVGKINKYWRVSTKWSLSYKSLIGTYFCQSYHADNIVRLEQNGDHIRKLLNAFSWTNGPFDSKPIFVQITDWHLTIYKPLYLEQWWPISLTHICVTVWQWVLIYFYVNRALIEHTFYNKWSLQPTHTQHGFTIWHTESNKKIHRKLQNRSGMRTIMWQGQQQYQNINWILQILWPVQW